MIPPQALFKLEALHRLIPSRYSDTGTVLADLADSARMLKDLVLLDGSTNDRLLAEQQGTIGISPYELVYGIPNAQIVNAAFTHASSEGGRFNDYTRGAWYAADELETSLAEVTYHKSRRLMDIVVPELPYQRPDKETATYDDWLADFHASFHFLKPVEKFSECLNPEPIPRCYQASQRMARDLVGNKSNGIVYPSVRRPKSRCLACFRPALVYNPTRGKRLAITFKATSTGYEHRVKPSK